MSCMMARPRFVASSPKSGPGGYQEAPFGRARPRRRVIWISVLANDVVGREPTTRNENTVQLAVESIAIFDVHRHMLKECHVEIPLFEGKSERIADDETDVVHLPGPPG